MFAALFPASVLLFSDVYHYKFVLDIKEISKKLETERRVFLHFALRHDHYLLT